MSIRSVLARVPGVRPANRLARRGLARLRALMPSSHRAADADSPETLRIRADLWRLSLTNRFSKRRIVDARSEVVLCTTTHGERIQTVHTAIESVGRGTTLPGRYILWLDDHEIASNLPSAIRRLQKRGLEVIEVAPKYKVHTKYYLYVQSVDVHTVPLATCEDDIVYPKSWLANLMATNREHPDCIATYRCHTVTFSAKGLAPYSSWIPTVNSNPSYRHFGTTVSGQMYSPEFVNFIKSEGDAFLTVSPTNDDLWIHHLAVRAGVRTVQVTRDQQHFPFVPGTQAHGLFWINVAGGQNDAQAAKTYDDFDIKRMRADVEYLA